MKCTVCNGTGKIDLQAMPLGNKLRYLREKQGLSLRAVEQATGVSNPLISQIESGHIKSPSFKAVSALCKLYGIKMEELKGIDQ